MDEQIERVLDSVIMPGAERSVLQLGLVRSIDRADGQVRIVLGDAGLMDDTKQAVSESLRVAVAAVTGEDALVEFSSMTTDEANDVRHTVAIMSGKGGVGKSLVTGLLAVALQRAGYRVGILDADLTGPSIPKMFGVEGRPYGNAGGIMPVLSPSGMPVMSMNLLLESSDQPVIWRGPLIDKALRQFGKDVLWGRLDYLLIDLPPGTADAVLTVMQAYPIDGVVVVFTPQDLVDMIVRKAINMAGMMQKRVLGVVENMSYLYVPELDKRPGQNREQGEESGGGDVLENDELRRMKSGRGVRSGHHRAIHQPHHKADDGADHEPSRNASHFHETPGPASREQAKARIQPDVHVGRRDKIDDEGHHKPDSTPYDRSSRHHVNESPGGTACRALNTTAQHWGESPQRQTGPNAHAPNGTIDGAPIGVKRMWTRGMRVCGRTASRACVVR